MDRVDSWLNSQVGWRRAILIWLTVCPAAILAGCGVWALVTPGAAGLGTGFVEVVVCSVIAVVPFAWLATVVQRRRVARGLSMPFFSWRLSASVVSMTAAVLPGVLFDQQPYWHHIHRAVDLSQMVFLIAAVVLFLLAARRNRRLAGSSSRSVQGRKYGGA